MQRVSEGLREQFPQRAHIFDDYQAEIGEWEAAFREYARIAKAGVRLLRVTRKLTARRLVAIQATNLASRAVNLANGVVLLLNRRHAHAAPAVARALFETCAMAVYAARRLVPLLVKRRSPKRTSDAHRLLIRLELGTDPRSETSHVKSLRVEAFVKAMCAEIDELMEDDEDDPPPWIAADSYGHAVERSYSLLSELTHPNSLAIALSQGRGGEWVLQPEIDETVLVTTLQPSWIALKAGRVALRDLVRAATDHPMRFPDADPGMSADDLNPRTRIWR